MADVNYKSIIMKASFGYAFHKIIVDKHGNPIDYMFLEVNPAFERITGLKAKEIIGKTVCQVLPGIRSGDFDWVRNFGNIALNLGERAFEQYSVPLERWYKVQAYSDKKYYFSTVLTDVTKQKQDTADHKQAEANQLKNEARLQSHIRILQHQTDSIRNFLDYALNEAIKLTESKIGYIFFYNEQTKEFTLNSWLKDVMQQCSIKDPPTLYQLDETGIWGEAVRQRKEIMVNNFATQHPLKKGYPEGHTPLKKFLTVPVFINKQIVAVVGVGNKETDYNYYDVLQLQLLMDSAWKEVERKKSLQALEESEEQHRRLFETMSQGVTYQVAEGKIVSANTAAEKILGISWDQMQGKTSMDPRWKMITEDGKKVHGSEQPVMIALKTGKKIGPLIRGVYIPEKDEYVWLSITATPLFKPGEDKPFQTYAVFDDITLRKKQEDALKKQQQLIRTILNKLPIGIAVINTLNSESKFELVNDNFARIYGVKTKDFPAVESLWDAVFEDEAIRAEMKKKILSDINSGDPNRMQWQDIPITKNGKIVKYVSANNIPLEEHDLIISTVIDTTEQKLAEIEITNARNRAEESEKKLKSISDSMLDLVSTADLQGFYRFVGPSHKILGYDIDWLIGKNILEFVHPDDLPILQERFKTFLENKSEKTQKQTIRYRYRCSDGSYLWFESIGTFLFDENDIPIEMLFSTRDITEQKRIEDELQIAKEKAEESDRLKSAFLANMTHEIRTPMNGILGFAELLKEPHLADDQQKEYIDIIEKSGERLLNIINNIVDISKIEAGVMEVEPKECNINEQLEYAYNFFKPEVEKKGLSLNLIKRLPAEHQTTITDREMLLAILTNLIKNAIKYSKAGVIEFGCRLKGASLMFFVKDTGVGIAKDRHQAIFDRFVQADIEDKEARQGAGLGLSISKAYVEMLGGEIWVDSEVGEGSTFYFTIPYRVKHQKTDTQKINEPEKQDTNEEIRLKILIVDDDALSSMLMVNQLQSVSKEVLRAHTGSEAITMCKEHPDIDLILMDMKMPGMGGEEAARQIRQFNKEVVIIAQTANALIGNREKMLLAGCNNYITKPLSKDKIQALVQMYFL